MFNPITKAMYRRNNYDWWGCQHVITLIAMRNRGKQEIPAGTICEVTGKHGGLHIWHRESNVAIRSVDIRHLALEVMPDVSE